MGWDVIFIALLVFYMQVHEAYRWSTFFSCFSFLFANERLSLGVGGRGKGEGGSDLFGVFPQVHEAFQL